MFAFKIDIELSRVIRRYELLPFFSKASATFAIFPPLPPPHPTPTPNTSGATLILKATITFAILLENNKTITFVIIPPTLPPHPISTPNTSRAWCPTLILKATMTWPLVLVNIKNIQTHWHIDKFLRSSRQPGSDHHETVAGARVISRNAYFSPASLMPPWAKIAL